MGAYQVRIVEIHDCLRLKTAYAFIPQGFLVVNPAWVDLRQFDEREVIAVEKGESFAVNMLTVSGATLEAPRIPKPGATPCCRTMDKEDYVNI